MHDFYIPPNIRIEICSSPYRHGDEAHTVTVLDLIGAHVEGLNFDGTHYAGTPASEWELHMLGRPDTRSRLGDIPVYFTLAEDGSPLASKTVRVDSVDLRRWRPDKTSDTARMARVKRAQEEFIRDTTR